MDLDRLLKDSLQKVGGEFHPSDPAAARQRFLAARRRRRWFVVGEAAGAVALATLLIVFVTTVDIGGERGLRLATSSPQVVATIPAGGEPVAVAVGEGAVWMTDSSGVKKIDPTTDEVLVTVPMGGGRPDEIVAGNGYVWATDTTGSVYKIDPETGVPEIYRLTGGDNVHLDIALSDTDLWAVDPASGITFSLSGEQLVGREPSSSGGLNGPDFSPSDVAADGPEVWGLDAAGGKLKPLVALETVSGDGDREVVPPDGFEVPAGDRNSDLAVGFGAAWIATGATGEVHRVSLTSGDVTSTIDVGGTYTDLSVDAAEGAVWALAIDQDGGDSELFQLDGRTGEVMGEPLLLDGVAADVSAGEGSIWVPGRDGDVLKIETQEDTGDVTDPSPNPSEGSADRIVFVFSKDGDLWAQYAERTERLTDTPEFESAPSVSPDGRYVVFERRAEGAPEAGAPAFGEDQSTSEIVVLDLTTGEECCTRIGTQPAIGPMQQLAFVVPTGTALPNGDEAQQPQIAFTQITSAKAAELFPAQPPEAFIPGMHITELLWDQSGQVMFLEVEYEGRHVRTANLIVGKDQLVEDMVPSEVIPTPLAGTRYLAPSVGTSLNLVQSCCGYTEGDLPERHLFGHMEPFPEQDFAIDRIVDLERLEGFDPPSLADPTGGPLKTAFIGQYSFDGETFRADDGPLGWLVGDGQGWWWVTADGDVTPTQLTADDIAAPYPYFDGTS